MKWRHASRILTAGAILSVLPLGTAHAQSAQTLGTIEQLFGMGTSLLNQGQSLEQQREMMRQENAIQQQQAGQAQQNQVCPSGERVTAVRVNVDGSRTVLCEPIR
jgi:hypothetical protein